MTVVTTSDRFGSYGGRYVPETLIPALDALELALADAMDDSDFIAELDSLLATYVGRPSPLRSPVITASGLLPPANP